MSSLPSAGTAKMRHVTQYSIHALRLQSANREWFLGENMNFIALDVETANADLASICQIGLARYEAGTVVQEWSTLVDPEAEFDWINVDIHGIDEWAVEGAPTFLEIAGQLTETLQGEIVVCHRHFDRVALNQSCLRYRIGSPNCTWLDSARVARRTWPQFASKGYGLANVCAYLGYEFRHHDALEDAKAAGRVLMAAIEQSGLSVEAWMSRVRQPIAGIEASRITRSGNPDGDLQGEVMVFTGELTLPRRQAADIAAALGCEVATSVTKKTTMLVVGDQDIQKLAGHEMSLKHRKAEELIRGGQAIRVLRETDFAALAKTLTGSY